MTKYNFSKNPPTTSEEIREYITSWLKPIPDDYPLYTHSEYGTFKQLSGFRRAFHNHCVFQNVDTKKYVWVTNEMALLESDFPTITHNTYENMMNYICNVYYKSWHQN